MPLFPGPRSEAVLLRALGTAACLAALLLVWNLVARSSTPIIVPSPIAVWRRFALAVSDGTFEPALITTLSEAWWGWALAALVALPMGYLIGRFTVLEDVVAPYLASSQAMPIVAVAPILAIWLGFGLAPKIAVCALIAFFPMLATTASGVRGVPKDLRDAALVFGAGFLQMAVYVDLPLAARGIFAGIKVAAALAVTGAIVGEFVSSDQGLGYLVLLGRTNFDTPLMFVAMLSLMVLGAAAYGCVSLVERIVLRWEE